MTTSTPTLIRDPWRRVWRGLAGDGALAVVAGGLGLLLALTALLPQTPGNDPIAYSRWLSEVQQRFGGLTAPLTSLGLFTITQSVLFRLALAALGVICAVRLIEAIDQLRALNVPPEWPAHPIVDLAIAADVAELRARLSGWRLREHGEIIAVDQHARRSAVSGLMLYSGALGVLLALVLGVFVDRRVDNLSVAPDAPATVSGTPYTLRLDEVSGEQATLALLSQTEVVARGPAALRRPLTAGSIGVYLQSIGPAVIISATNAAGQPLGLQSTADTPPQPSKLLAFTPDRTEGFVAAPEAGVVLQVAPRDGGYNVQAYQSATGEILGGRDVAAGETFTVSPVTFHFEPAAFVVVSVVSQPSHWLMIPAALLIVCGVIGGWSRPRRLWLRAVEAGTQLAGDDAAWTARLAAESQADRLAVGERRAQFVFLLIWLAGTLALIGWIGAAYPLAARLEPAARGEAWIGAWLALTAAAVARRRGAQRALAAVGVMAAALTILA